MVINNENKIKRIHEVDCITVDKSAFEDVKNMLEEIISDKCKYCGDQITKDTFGLIYNGITSCKNIVCLTEAYDEIEEDKKTTHKKEKQNEEEEENSKCPHCETKRAYSEKYDKYYCPKCMYWLERICPDRNCEFCKDCPKYPSKEDV